MRKYEITVLSKGAYARTVRIYAKGRADRAVIFHDGQSVFEQNGLNAVKLLKSAKIKNIAVIAVDGANRTDDYIPFPVESGETKSGGKTDKYKEFILETLIPYLDKRFGFKFYAMAGIGLSAAATLYIAAERSERINAYGLFSLPLFFCPVAFDRFLNNASFASSAMFRIYTGGSERPEGLPEQITNAFVADSFKAVNALRASGVKDLALSLINCGTFDDRSRLEYIKRFITDFSKV